MSITQVVGEEQQRISLSIEVGDEPTSEQTIDLGQHMLSFAAHASRDAPLY